MSSGPTGNGAALLSALITDQSLENPAFAPKLWVMGAIGFDVGRETLSACRGAENLVKPAANLIVANDDNYALAA